MTPIEDFASSLATSLRDRLKQLEDLSYFNFKIVISGRVHSGDLKVAFEISDSDYGKDVKGGSYNDVIIEFMRRHGWDKLHAPLMIGYDGAKSDAEELPNA